MSNEQSISPMTFDEYVGQTKPKRILQILCESAKKSGRMPSHILLQAGAGLGKTTLARIMAAEMNCKLTEVVAGNIQQPEQLTNLFFGLEEKSLVFVDEIHSLSRLTQELLFPAMEGQPIPVLQQGFNDLLSNIGMSQQKPVRLHIELPPFTLIGATTLQGLVSAPLRSRFTQTLVLDPYSIDELSEIVMRASLKISIKISQRIAVEIAKRSRSTARLAIGNLTWLNEYCTATNMKPNLDSVSDAFELKSIDNNGLTKTDRAYLKILVNAKAVVGLSTLSVTLGEDSKSIEDTVEPYLLREGYIRKTAKGRAAEQKAYDLFSARRKLRVA